MWMRYLNWLLTRYVEITCRYPDANRWGRIAVEIYCERYTCATENKHIFDVSHLIVFILLYRL